MAVPVPGNALQRQVGIAVEDISEGMAVQRCFKYDSSKGKIVLGFRKTPSSDGGKHACGVALHDAKAGDLVTVAVMGEVPVLIKNDSGSTATYYANQQLAPSDGGYWSALATNATKYTNVVGAFVDGPEHPTSSTAAVKSDVPANGTFKAWAWVDFDMKHWDVAVSRFDYE